MERSPLMRPSPICIRRSDFSLLGLIASNVKRRASGLPRLEFFKYSQVKCPMIPLALRW